MRKLEILDAQEDRGYGKTNRGSDYLMNCVAVRTVGSGSVRQYARRWKRRPLLLQRVNARRRLIRPEPRLMPPRKPRCQRLSKRT